MSALIGKRIECHLETSTNNKQPFTADVKAGRREGEVFLVPIGDAPPGTRGYRLIGEIYVRKIVGASDEGPKPDNVTKLPRAPTVEEGMKMLAEIERLQKRVAELEAELAAKRPTDAAPEAPPPLPESAPAPVLGDASPPPDQAELTDGRRLSESPVSEDTRRRRGRGGPLDHGEKAERPDAFQDKPGK